MKEIQKVVQKLSREQESAAGGGGAGGGGGGGGAGSGVRTGTKKNKVTPGLPGWLNEVIWYGLIRYPTTLMASSSLMS